MNVYAITNFAGHYPVGTAAIVAARDTDQATLLLLDRLVAEGLGQQDVNSWDFKLIDPAYAHAIVLLNGDY